MEKERTRLCISSHQSEWANTADKSMGGMYLDTAAKTAEEDQAKKAGN